MHKIVALALLALVLEACQTTNSGSNRGAAPRAANNIGTGPITLSPKVNADFQRYLSLREPRAFAVSSDGRYGGYYYCTTPGTCTFDDANAQALKYCRNSTPPTSGACKIYAVGKRVVWGGGAHAWDHLVGSGLIKFSRSTSQYYQAYRKAGTPLAFAVSPDGRHSGWVFCKTSRKCSYKNLNFTQRAIDNCNTNTPRTTGRCKLYSVKNNVVWKAAPSVPPTPSVNSRSRDWRGLVGTTPLRMTRKVNGAYQNYLRLKVPLAFAVSPRGDHAGWAFCKKAGTCNDINPAQTAIVNCNKFTPQADRPCKLYAVNKNVVWQSATSGSSNRSAWEFLIGKTPLRLSNKAKMSYREYMKINYPLAFAVSPDGVHSGWNYCNSANGCSEKTAVFNAIKYCNDRTRPGSAPCRIYAIKRYVVWSGSLLR